MHLSLGPPLIGQPPPSQGQLPLGLAPTGDFAFVRERVLKDAQDKWDALTPRREIRLHQGRVWFPEAAQSDFSAGFLAPTPWATSQFCQRLGMPTSYFRKCPPALQDVQFNHWVGTETPSEAETAEVPFHGGSSSEGNASESVPIRWLLRAKGDVLRGVLSERYAPLDNDCLVECLAALLPKAFAVDWFSLDDTSLHLRLVDCRHTRQILPGDDLMVGFHIGNSEVGRRAVTVDALIYRLVCQNGLIRLVKGRSLLYRRHLHLSAPRFREVLQGAILGALDAATAFLDQLQESSRTPVPDVPSVLALLAHQENLSKSFVERVEQSLRAEPAAQQETVWGLVNGLTQAAQGLPADDRYQVETLAGRLIEHGPPRMPSRPGAPLLRGRRLLAIPSAADGPLAGNGSENIVNEQTEREQTENEESEREDSGYANKGDRLNGFESEGNRSDTDGHRTDENGHRFDEDRSARPVLGRA